MPMCNVYRCTNGDKRRGGISIRIFHFPECELLREEWIQACGFDNDFILTKDHRICAAHFRPEDFIPDDLNLTRKGKKRAYPNLKPNAVPSIFSRDRKDFASSECKGPKVRIGPNKFLKKMKTEKSGDAKTVYLAKKLKEKEHINMRSYCSKLEQDLMEKQREIESLKEQMQNFKSFLNQDQIDGVMRNSSVRYWSDQTVTECLKIRHACGKSGYDYLRSKGFPFPNILLVDDQNQASQISGEVVMLNPPKIQDDPLY